jgi:hypothetical protein
MIRPWYRSRLFWLGLPGLVFLLWLWLIFSPRAICIDAGQRSFDLLSFRSALELTTSDDRWAPPAWEIDVFPLDEEADRIDPGDHLFKRDYHAWPGEIDVGGVRRLEFFRLDYVSMRPWLPVAAYLVLWVAALALWQWRKTRLSRRGAEA